MESLSAQLPKSTRASSVLRWGLAAALLFAVVQWGTLAHATNVPIVLASDTDPGTHGSKWSLLVLTEAFKRMGVPLQVNSYPMARRTTLADLGEVDGDVGRSSLYGAEHPNLVRVEEAWSEQSFGLYTGNPGLRLEGVEELRGSELIVEYRRGILLCESKLKSLNLKWLSDITNQEQGVKKLALKRTDIYCDLDNAVRNYLNATEFKNDANLRRLIGLGSLPIHTYLHRKHAQLAQRLAATLKTMKAQGLMEKYRVQVERELGWTR